MANKHGEYRDETSNLREAGARIKVGRSRCLDPGSSASSMDGITPLVLVALIGVPLNWEIIKRSVLDVSPLDIEASNPQRL